MESASPSEQGSVAAQATPVADVQPWKAGPVPGGDGKGPVFPTVWPASVVSGSGLATSLWPTLQAQGLEGRVDVEIVDLSTGGGFGEDGQGEATGVVWTDTVDAQRIDLPQASPVLLQGRAYAYRARSGDEWQGPWTFSVDTVRRDAAPVDSLAGVQVNLMSGVASTAWTSPTFPGAVGAIGVGLAYSPGSPVTPGLPEGWSWLLPGTGLIGAVESEARGGAGEDEGPLSVQFVTADGSGPTFVRTPTGAYVPGLADGTSTSYTLGGTVARPAADSWTYTDPGGTVTQFVGGRATAQWSGGVPVAAYSWDGEGRLVSVADGTEGGRVFTLSYAEGCEAGNWSGFVLASGMWCSLRYPDGRTAQAGYVEQAGGPRLATVVEPGGNADGWGWDGAGRLAAVRVPLVTAMAAVDQSYASREFLTEIAYDADGRVASVTAGAPEAGAERVRREYSYPTGSDLSATVTQSTVSGAKVAAVASSLGGGVVLEVSTDPTWRVERRTAIDGRESTLVYDEQTGDLVSGRLSDGRAVTFAADDAGLAKSSIGPFRGEQALAPKATRTLDATVVDPDRGVDSATKPWTGLAALVWPDGRPAAVPGWWDSSVLVGELKASFDSAPVEGAKPGPWRAQATGVWRVAKAGDYSLTIKSAEGTDVAVTVGAVRCTSAQGSCPVRLSKGEQQLTLFLDVTDSKGSASFLVSAESDDGSGRIETEDLRPQFDVATRMSTNDDVGKRNLGAQVLVMEEPWRASPDRLVTSGGRTMAFDYESIDANAGAFGRQLSVTTPGSSTMTSAFYGIGESATDPCTQAQYPQSGLLKSVTRYDGVTITTVYDGAGRPVAVTTQGDGMSELSCTSYDAGGRPVSSSVSDTSGAVIEQASVVRVMEGGRLVSTTTSTLGPAAAEGAGQTFTSSSALDLAGRPVELIDSSGTRTRFGYSADSSLLQRQVWAPGAEASGPATLTVDFAYDDKTALPMTTSVNGRVLAEATYDADGLLTDIDYADDVSMTLEYGVSGSLSRAEVAADGRRYESARERNAMGRSLFASLTVSEAKKTLTSQEWSYDYDDAGRLTRAVLTTEGDQTSTGGAKREFGYDYGAAADGCFPGAGANLDRTGGTRDGEAYQTCRDERGRLRWTTDPHLTGGSGKAEATYDGLGRLTALGGEVPLELTWSSGTQLARMSEGGAVTSWVIAGGSVQSMTSGGDDSAVVTRYGYAGSNVPTFVLDGAGTVLDTRVSLPGGVIAHLGADIGTDAVTLDFADLYGAALLTTVAGRPQGETGLAPRGGPFGEPLVPADTPQTSAATGIGTGTTYGFQALALNPTVVGHHSLTITERPYHPWLGEFLASDPAPGASTTAYGYGEGNPVDQPDFTGAWGIWDTLGVIGGGVALIAGVASGTVLQGAGKWAKVGVGLAIAGAALGVVANLSPLWDKSQKELSGWRIAAGIVGVLSGAFGAWRLSKAKPAAALQQANQAPQIDDQLAFSGVKQGGQVQNTAIDLDSGVVLRMEATEEGATLWYEGQKAGERYFTYIPAMYSYEMGDDVIRKFMRQGQQAGYVTQREIGLYGPHLQAYWSLM